MKEVTKQTYTLFWQHAKPYKWLVFVMFLALAGTTAIEVIVPLFYKRFFDVIASQGAVREGATLVHIIVQVLILYSIAWVLWRVSGYAVSFLEPRIMVNLVNTSFEYLHNHSYGFFINRFAGALVRKVNRIASAFEGIFDALYWNLFPLVLKTTGILIVLFYKNVKLGLIMLLWSIVFMTVNYVLTMYKLKYDVEAAEMDTTTTAALADTITNQVNIKIFARLKEEFLAFKALTERQFRTRRFTENLGVYIEGVQAALTTVLEFLIFYFAISLWQKGILTVGDFVLIQAYIMQMIYRLWDFGRIFRRLYRNLADAEEMVEILNTPHEIRDLLGAGALHVSEGKLEFRKVDFSYIDGRPVIKDLNLIIRPGEKVGVVGPSGAGKTTLSALLFRFYDLSDGHIMIDGQDIVSVTQESLRKNIALVPQDPILFHRTLLDNIRYGKSDASDEEVMRAAELAHCDEFIESLPNTYQTFVGERGIKLSGGERQRVAIARAILKNAPILVLDEATSSLDSHSESLIQDALANLMQGKTTIVIAHRLSTIMKMDRIIVLRDGTLSEEGTHNNLLKTPGSLYKKLWELQVGGFIA